MPELPEVETTLRGITSHILDQPIQQVIIRRANLRWPIPADLTNSLKNNYFIAVKRRGKYLLLNTHDGTLLIHLGMSGSLRILTQTTAPKKHDHLDIIFNNKKVLRFTDPRRFGAILWLSQSPHSHALLKTLGIEPLEKNFSGNYLWQRAQKKKVAIKSFIMNNKIVVGIGNIYATESLFTAGIHPEIPAGKINLAQYKKLVIAIKKILRQAIKCGGTTLKDFVDSTGKPGYFKLQLKAYGREGLPCLQCKTILQNMRLGQRSCVFCKKCQPIKY